MTNKTSLFKALSTTIILVSSLLFNNANANESKLKRHANKVIGVTKKAKKESTNKSLPIIDSKELNSQYASWGIKPEGPGHIKLENAWKRFKKKKDIVVAVIDTGVDPNHSFLKDNLYIPNEKITMINYGLDFSKSKKSSRRPYDSHGHGTHVAGIVKSVFPKVKLMVLKYYNPSASGQDNLNSTIEALRYAVNQNVDIINYSGGGPEPALEELRVLKLAEKKGILVVAAAGNEESNIDQKNNAYYPASYGLSNIITVAAHDQKLKLLTSSNYGAKSVDIVAPGYRINSAFPRNRKGILTGTSQATAFVSGVAALLLSQFPDFTAADLKSIITKSAKKEVTLLKKCNSGGRLDASKAQELALSKKKTLNRSLAQKSNLPKRNKQGKIIYRLYQ